ncbi:MAG TPA: hypothetical protein VHT05_11045 [Candidatus Elarobacter sp.]|nr:hypothetical protein [Candidatus Elarobacter sp.]
MASTDHVANFIDRTRLLSFLGFGNTTAAAVFIGMEEGLTVPPALDEQLATRSAFEPIMDLAASAKAHPERFLSGSRPPIQSTWNVIIRVLLALEGTRPASTDDVRLYQRDRLGRSHERGALIELMPLPARGLAYWPYGELFPDYPTREQYLAALKPYRVALLQEHLSYEPQLVIAYGASYWDDYKLLFPAHRSWKPVGPFSISDSGPCRVILTPHLTARQMNGQRDLLIDLAVGSR